MLHRAGRNDFAGIDKKDLVRVGNGIQAMRNDDLSRRLRQLAEYLLELLLGHRVDVCGCFVENQDLRIAQHGAHESNELLLSQADGISAGSDFRLESFFES